MPITDIFQMNRIKAELEQAKKERDTLRTAMAETGWLEAYDLKKVVQALEERKNQAICDAEAAEASVAQKRQALERQIEERKNQASREAEAAEAGYSKKRQALSLEIDKLNQQIAAKKENLIIMDDEILLQSFGMYKPRYDLMSSEAYKAKLEQIRERQETMVKNGKAAYGSTSWTVNNSKTEGERMVKDYVKLILRSFNNECDASITNVKFNNVESIAKKIRKAQETLNKLGTRMSIVITQEYLNLKLEELYLCYEYQVKKQEEKEEQKRIREQMREEAKLLKEIEEQKAKLEKDEKHINIAIEAIDSRLQTQITDADRKKLEDEKASLQQKMVEIGEAKQEVDYREQNARAGYVYVISNVGSFGENIYKIGMTRRLDPQERVDELGDASVPFDFDVHAMVFSDDAPALETALHKAFEHRRLNMINNRREFFQVTLDEIENVVKTNFNKPVEFAPLADAAEYRQSLALKGVLDSVN